jgi:YegS/Rv2252/BmrU family lipid kinase
VERKTFFVVNPHSAHGRTAKAWPEIKAMAEKTLGPVTAGFTERMGHATDLVRAALHQGFNFIVSVGGDGTNNEVVNGFFESGRAVNPEAAMGIVCSGTGSDLIRTLLIPRDFHQAIPMIPTWDPKPTDAGRLTFINHQGRETARLFINITSAGVGGEVDDRVNKTTKIFGGKASFLWGSLRGALAYTNKRLTIRLDNGEPFERTVFNLAVSNGQFFGAGMQTAPRAEVDDGLFDVVVMGDFSFFEQLRLSRLIYSGAHLGMAKVESFRAKKVELTCPDRVLLDVDGEQPGMLPATLELLPAAIKIVRP